MRYVSIVGFACLLLANCSPQEGQAPKPATTPATISIEETQTATPGREVNGLRQEVASLRKDLEVRDTYLAKDPKFYLYLMDKDLAAIEAGGEAVGSFSDYFVPNAAKALENGASMKDIETRISRVITLAERGVYLSSFVKTLMDDGGAQAVRSYAHGWIGQ